jgi:hypothetical protein
MAKRKPKKQKETKGREQLRQVLDSLHDDISFLQYIITCSDEHECKQDLMFDLHSMLSERTSILARLFWQKEKI